MTVGAAVVRWGVVVMVMVMAGAAQGTSLADMSRCKNSCSSVPEDLWPVCCETHRTCCRQFAESCMHDCLPRVHTGDIGAVEERPGMCCALYNLCCFRETFRISSSKTTKQEPTSFPILHRFHVHPLSGLGDGIRPPSRPTSLAEKEFIEPDQDLSKRSNFPRPGGSKNLFRPRPGGINKLPGTGNNNDNEANKLENRLKLPSILSDNNNPSDTKVTRRPVGIDIRQEVIDPEVGQAKPMGARRLDASINPVVTRKRLLVSSRPRSGRQEGKKEEEEQEAGGRRSQGKPAREGRTLGAGRSSARPAAQQTSSRGQTGIVAGIENPRIASRRPAQSAPRPTVTPKQNITPRVTIKQSPSVALDTARTSEPVKEAKIPAAEEAKDSIDSIISVLEKTQDTPSNDPSAVNEEAPAEDNPVAAASQPEEAVEEAPVVKEAETVTETQAEGQTEAAETEKATTDAEETPTNTAFVPPEIVVDTPEEPKEEAPAPVKEEPAPQRSRDTQTSPARTQTSAATTSQDQTRSQRGEQTRGRNRASTRDQTGDRTSSRTADQSTTRGTTDTARQSSTRERSRTRGRTEAEEAAPTQPARTRG